MEQNKENGISKKRMSKWVDWLEASKAAAVLSSVVGKVPLLKKINQLSKRKQRIAYTLLFLVIVIGVSAAAVGSFRGEKKEVSYTEHEVAKGDVTVVISGEGTVAPIEQYSVIALVEGDVLEDTFQEGDTVEKGQTLYRIDSSDMEKTLEKANISYEKAQMAYQDSLEAYQGLTVSAPISGRITDVFVEKGDNVSSGTKIAAIVDDSNLTAKVSFGTADAGSLYVGQPVTVTVENTFETLNGKVSKIYSSKRVLDGYIEVKDVEVTIENPGALDSGTYVTVNAGGIDCYSGAQLEGGSERIVTAKTSGLVSKILASSGEYLTKGDDILQMTNDGADNTLKSSQFSLRESQLSYESSQDQLDEYNVTAPISGTVIEKDIKAGDTLESSNSGSTTLCVIADMSVMTFTINVDELDIAQLEKGQEVSISADALSDRDFTGYVDNIGILGTSSDGVTSYPVKIVINDAADLWPGMNVSAEIIVDSAEDVIRVPVTAVNRGNTVLVKGAKGDEKIDQSGAPQGAKYVRVQIGLNDESYIEITDGLAEGDIVLVPEVKSSSTESSSQQMMPGGGMSGPPSGGGNGGRSSGGGNGGPPSGGGGPGM